MARPADAPSAGAHGPWTLEEQLGFADDARDSPRNIPLSSLLLLLLLPSPPALSSLPACDVRWLGAMATGVERRLYLYKPPYRPGDDVPNFQHDPPR